MINSSEMKIVMQRLMAKMIFTTQDGKKSKKIVRNSTRAVNNANSDAIANKMPATPDMTDPVRNDWQKQHVFRRGPAILLM